MKKLIKASLDHLAGWTLEQPQEYQEYSDEDLLNATLIFSHVLIDKVFETNQKLSQKELENLALTTGEAIRELIRSATGLDMHKVTKQVLKK